MAVRWLVLAVSVSGLVVPYAAFGQKPTRYEPARPTVSPYLNLLRDDTGTLPNYHGLVRPQLQQQHYNRQTVDRLRNQQVLALEQQSQLQQLGESFLEMREPEMRPTGVRAGFQMQKSYFALATGRPKAGQPARYKGPPRRNLRPNVLNYASPQNPRRR